MSPDAPPAQQALALIFRAAAGPATESELSGGAAAIDAFVVAVTAPRAQAGMGTPRRPVARKTPLLAAAIMAAVIAGLGGTAAANVLPAPLQQLAHVVFNAPSPARPGPAVTGPAGTGGPVPTLSTTAGHPAASPSPTANAKASATATSGAGGNGNGNGTGNGNGNSKAHGNGNGQGNGNGNGKGNGKGKGKEASSSPPS